VSTLPAARAALPQMSDAAVAAVRRVESAMRAVGQVHLDTDHLIHGGMYARTIRIPPRVALAGVLITRATTVILSGDATVFTGSESVHLTGYHVLPASAGRKQVFVSHAETYLTMLFPTRARTVEEAETEFTDEPGALQARAAGDSITITGE